MTDHRTLTPEDSQTDDSLTVPKKMAPALCRRCNGAGGRADWPGYTCLLCNGEGHDPVHKNWVFPSDFSHDDMLAFYDKKEKEAQTAREYRARKKEEKAEQTYDENLEAFPWLKSVFDDQHDNPFLADIADKAVKFPLTENQALAALAAWTSEIEEERRRSLIPAIETANGTKVEGVIHLIRFQDNEWGGGMKMLIELDSGQKLWGTVPKTLDDAGETDRVVFTANVKASDDDPTFGFFSRPRKGRILDHG